MGIHLDLLCYDAVKKIQKSQRIKSIALVRNLSVQLSVYTHLYCKAPEAAPTKQEAPLTEHKHEGQRIPQTIKEICR